MLTPFIFTGNRPTENWQLYSDDDTMKQFARLVDMYKAVNNYTQAAMDTYTQTGKPLQRALFYEYPGDSRSWEIEHQYMYGDELLVAPVLEVDQCVSMQIVMVG